MVENIRFTKHADDKFKIFQGFGFSINKSFVEDTVRKPFFVSKKEDQILALKPIDDKLALRVVYEKRGNENVVITFYPVKRERYGI